MARPSIDARRFYRAAAHRLAAAKFLLRNSTYTTDAVYLAGYAVECMLKGLILCSEPPARNTGTLRAFRGANAHDFEWLKECLARRRVPLSADVTRELTKMRGWSTDLRYEPKVLRRIDADRFLLAAEKILLWAKGRM